MDKSKSPTASSAACAEYSANAFSAVSKQAITSATVETSSEDFRARPRRIVQNFLLVWLDANIDEGKEDFQKALTALRKIFVTVEPFTDVDQCVDYLTSIDDQKIYLITSASLGQTTVPLIHDIAQLDTIFVFCSNKDEHKFWAKECAKVKGIHDSIQPICMQLIKATQSCDHDAIPMSFIPKRQISEAASTKQNLDQLPPSYMYSVIFKDIILEIDHDDNKSMNTLVNFCRQQNIPEIQINLLQSNYHEKSPIWWYTKPMFLYGMLNRALRMLDMEVMIKLGFFIQSLHLQLEQLHQAQSANFQQAFTVYRGQELSQKDFQNLLDSKGGLLSFNNFLSTSKERDVATLFVQEFVPNNKDIVSVLFIMTIDPTTISTSITPFAMIHEHSAISSEQEILFTMHTVFRVVEIQQTTKNNRLWEVQLTITDESDPQLAGLTDHIKEEVQDSTGWRRMGKLMLQVGHFDQAEELYNELLENASTDSDRAHVYHQLGYLKNDQGKYPEAAKFYEKSLAIKRKTLPEDSASLAATYGNIGGVHYNMGEYSKALEFYEKDLEITKISLPANHPSLATSYNNIGLVYDNMGEYSKALEFYEKSLEITKISLPANHPSLATSYNNIGSVYDSMREYSKALEFYEKDLEITKISLPENHPALATSYNNIGSVYDNMGEYSKALEFYEKSLKIKEISLAANHSSLATSYTSIGSVYNNMREYSKALEYYEKSLKIREISLPPTHPDLATSYNNIGLVYSSMGEYSKALSYLEKALSIYRNSLPETHPNIQVVLSSIAAVKKKL
ncbi:unnamed protein product [Rotaria socialis]|uniref:NAD(P)(+)--arginine ADP-ribosyltransferase n=2 Tax=Rotaria socialis TaxID=392032 RepID=A0A821D7J7_9BILA|nr:unnamed protein product [Rotaria socialis]CAF4616365.1 unnamed protein product [Rotaria socialis]